MNLNKFNVECSLYGITYQLKGSFQSSLFPSRTRSIERQVPSPESISLSHVPHYEIKRTTHPTANIRDTTVNPT